VLSLLAHAAPISYRFPLPIWIYAVAGGVAVLASAPAAALGFRADPRERRSGDLYRFFRPFHLGAVGTALCGLLLVWGLVGAFGATGDEAGEFLENPITVLFWVDFWVGLGLLSTLVGNVWDLISPLNAAARALDRALARRGTAVRAYPAVLGRWPAVALILAWTWCELVWAPAKQPHVLGALILGYLAATLAGSAVFGARAWLDNVEVFTVLARTFSRLAPLELDPRAPDDWLDAPKDERRVVLRWCGAGLRSEGALPAGGGAFGLAVLATVVFDGFASTSRFTDLASWVHGWTGSLTQHEVLFHTLVMAAIVLLFVLAYVAVCALVSRGESAASAARRYAPTLVPIAAVYFVAHYFTYFLIAGQDTLAVLVDPFAQSWNPGGLGEYDLHRGFLLASAVWWAQVAVIVFGHIVSVFAAHRASPERRSAPARALAMQSPLVLLMVTYTMAGLWVLAQQIKAGG
jgi:hypothetical protein